MGESSEWKLYIPSVDIPYFTAAFIYALLGNVNTNLNLQRACHLILGNKKSDCQMLGNENNNITQALEGDAQYVTNQIELVRQCTESIVVMLISLLIGPWTDKFGRKPGMVLTWTGFTLNMGFGVIYTSFDMSPWYNLLGGIPLMICGGYFSFTNVANTYLTDITTNENRGLRLAIFNSFGLLGFICGTFATTPLLHATSYFQVNVITTACLVSCWIFILFGIRESLPEVQKEGKIRGFFDFSSPKEMFETTFKTRTGGNRDKILLISVIGGLLSFIFLGETTLNTLYLRKKFGWVMNKYTIYNGLDSVVKILGTVLGTILLIKWLKLRESVACVISFILTVIGAALMGLAKVDWEVYLVSLIRCTDMAQMGFVTSLTSKLVAQDEIGKVLSSTNGVKFLVSVLSSPVYTAAYNATLTTDPGIYNFLSCAVASVAVVLMIWIIIVERKHSQISESANPSITSLKATESRTVRISDVIGAAPRYSLVM